MPDRKRATLSELRQAIECLPRDTKIAMLNGIRANEIIVGAYTHRGGVCPMLAAHRQGGRTSFISFAKAWDRFAFRDARVSRARRATKRELLILCSQLEASLLEQDAPVGELAAAVAEHRALIEQRQLRELDRSGELRTLEGRSWTRVARRRDDYGRALDLLHAEHERVRAERQRARDQQLVSL
jgi:hypothetical protein